jgi:hypothetical protein
MFNCFSSKYHYKALASDVPSSACAWQKTEAYAAGEIFELRHLGTFSTLKFVAFVL